MNQYTGEYRGFGEGRESAGVTGVEEGGGNGYEGMKMRGRVATRDSIRGRAVRILGGMSGVYRPRVMEVRLQDRPSA